MATLKLLRSQLPKNTRLFILKTAKRAIRWVMVIAFSIGVLLLPATSLQGQTLAKSAADIVKICAEPNVKKAARNTVLALNYGYCVGYFQGVLVTHYLYHQIFDRLKATPSVAGLERADAF